MSIKTLTPHYLYIPRINPLTGVVCNSYTADIFIWSGSKSTAPEDPKYSITKINASAATGFDKINVSRIVNDFIDFDFPISNTTFLNDGYNQVWVMVQCTYDDVPDIPGYYDVQLAIKGYGYYMEGENPQLPANKVLLSGDEFKVSRNSMFVLPLKADEPTVATRVLEITNMVKLGITIFQATPSANFTYPRLYLFVRAVGDTQWIPTNPAGATLFALPDDLADGTFEYKGAAFDNITSQMIYSDTYTFIP